MPDTIVAFRLTALVQSGLQESLRGSIPIHYTAVRSECEVLLQQHRAVALIIQVPSMRASAELLELLELRSHYPFVSVTGIFHDADSDLSAVARLGSAGILDMIPAEAIRQSDFVRSILSRGHIESLVSRIWRLSELTVDDLVATVLRPAVGMAHSPISLPRLAAAKHMHERSLRKYCATHGLASPQWIIGWARTLVIAYYLEEHGRSVQSIATLLGFSSPSLLTNHLRRYTGMTARELREGTPLDTVARKLEEALMPTRGFADLT
ncbi:MAG: helix-turn-helix domain-containing protein [Gemmatimonadaceae bacterium]|nr:helix-turn-helix domain-containing protein [Gemmatimonadaceae bacterium]